ncbi:MAG: hypothetical protein WD768_14295 [Phycisphaeraceae bacterium]
MNISLSREVEEMIKARIASGEFPSESAFLEAAAVSYFQGLDESPEYVEYLRREVAKGVAEAKAGLARPWDVAELVETKRRRKGA